MPLLVGVVGQGHGDVEHGEQPTLDAESLGERLAHAVRGRDAVGTVAAAIARARVRAGVLSDAPPAVQLGRYVVLQRIGRGGMGVVYAAYDPQLDRRVALKVLHGSSFTGGSERQPQLLREAQALARLTHPNVVTVYDVGTFDVEPLPAETDGEPVLAPAAAPAAVFVAMEYVDGCTLGQWLADAKRSTAEIVAVMVDAGRGLAAAHARGIVHRDFKPDNVMIGRDGRVRVMDFGLAAVFDALELAGQETDERDVGDQVHVAQLASTWSKNGNLAGTPGYMAPEQLRGEEATPAADQFGFCVTLWEALYGRRPFTGHSLLELCAAILDGRIATPTTRASAPRWLRAAIERGLSTEPADRFPAMEALLAALGADPRRTRIRIGLAASVVALGLGAVAWQRVDRARRTSECEADAAVITDTWGDESRAAMQASFRASDVAYAETTWARLAPRLDDYASAWQTMRAEACIETRVAATRSDELYAWTSECLDERRRAFAKLVDVLAIADPPAVRNAVTAASALPRLDRCRDDQWLAQRTRPPADEALREQVAAERERLAEARALAEAGHYADASALARAVVEQARALDWGPLLAESLLRAGEIADKHGDYGAAEAALREAYFIAGGAAADENAADAALRLVFTVGYHAARHDEGLAWAEHARMVLRRLGEDTDGWRMAALLSGIGAIQFARSDYAAAIASDRQALEIRERTQGADDLAVVPSLEHLGASHARSGEFDAAHDAYARALAIAEGALGGDHPKVGFLLNGLGGVALLAGREDEGVEAIERGLAVLEAGLGDAHPDVALAAANLAEVHAKRGAYDVALRGHERALAILERALGPEHPRVGDILVRIGTVQLSMGAIDDALATGRRAQGIAEAAFGPEHPSVADALDLVGAVHRERGAWGEALFHYRRALEVREHLGGRDDPSLAPSLVGIGESTLARGHAAEAAAVLERAVMLWEKVPTQPSEIAYARFALARALVASDGDHTRARTLAEQARAIFADAGARGRVSLARVDAWLALDRRHRR